MTKPVIAWRHYLGGTLNSDQLLTLDLDGDDNDELLLLAGGALAAKTPQDTIVWQSPRLELRRIVAIADLDQDGAQEIVVSSRDRVHVLSALNGNPLWSLPTGAIGAIGAVRLADFDRDTLPELYVADAACGSLGSLGDIGQVWSFASGMASPSRLFELERGRRDYICGVEDSIVDVTGDGQLDIVTLGSSFLYVYSGVDGSLISASESIGSIPYGAALVEVADIDGEPAMELICYTNNPYAAPINSRRVFAMDWDESSGRLVKRWERSVKDTVNDRHAFGPGGLGDVDGDGIWEVVTSFYDASLDEWTTSVLDAATGVERANIHRGPFRGLADLDADGVLDLAVGDRRTGLSTYRWSDGRLLPLFVTTRFEPLSHRVRDASAPTSATTAVLALDLDDSPPAELIGLSFAADGTTPEALVALTATEGSARESARLGLAGEASILVASVGKLAGAKKQLLVARSDGLLWALDRTLAPTNATDGGLRFGGYYSGLSGVGRAPLAADFDGDGSSEIVAVDSRQVLLLLSAESATVSHSPVTRLRIPEARLPVLADLDADGMREIVHWSGATEAALRAVRAKDGSRMWQRTIATSDMTPANDLMTGDVDGDGRLDVVYTLTSSAGGAVRINAARGDNGARRWPADYEAVVAGSGLGVGSLFDRDGDGAVDVLAAPRYYLQWLDGHSGTPGPQVDSGYADYGLFQDLDADPAVEVIGSGGLYGLGSYELDLSSRWRTSDTRHARINGGVSACRERAPVYASGHNASARLSTWSASTGAIIDDVALRAGRMWNPAASAPDGVGQLGNATISPDLIGDGHPIVLVPSSDGYLYALDACDMRLVWALEVGAPVGEAILADTDGDGEDEIVLTAADGFLYGIDQQRVPSPDYVYENDGQAPANSAAQDIDTVVSTDTLYANWAQVAGATSYQYAIMAGDGSFLTAPQFLDVGASTSVAARGLELQAGHRYTFAVRAKSAMGTSVERLSDGVIVQSNPCGACGEGTQCLGGRCVAGDLVDAGLVDAGGGPSMFDGGLAAGEDSGRPGPDSHSCAACGPGTRCLDGMCLPEVSEGGPKINEARITAAGGGGCVTSHQLRSRSNAADALIVIFVAAAGRRRRTRGRKASA